MASFISLVACAAFALGLAGPALAATTVLDSPEPGEHPAGADAATRLQNAIATGPFGGVVIGADRALWHVRPDGFAPEPRDHGAIATPRTLAAILRPAGSGLRDSGFILKAPDAAAADKQIVLALVPGSEFGRGRGDRLSGVGTRLFRLDFAHDTVRFGGDLTGHRTVPPALAYSVPLPSGLPLLLVAVGVLAMLSRRQAGPGQDGTGRPQPILARVRPDPVAHTRFAMDKRLSR